MIRDGFSDFTGLGAKAWGQWRWVSLEQAFFPSGGWNDRWEPFNVLNQDLPDFWINRIILSAFQNLSLKWDVSFHCSKKSRKSCNPENQGSKTIPKAAQWQPKSTATRAK
ncbi:hypothetical protein ACX8XN_13785 [Calditrichota bacterium GD2]